MEKMINHFSHRHPLILRSSLHSWAPIRGGPFSLIRLEPDKHCSACQKCYEGPAYCCDDCRYYLHESCAGLPFEIQHFYHSSHSLNLHGIEYDTAVNCDMCQESWMGFTYRCNHCDFKMDIQCAKLQPVIQLSIHPDHPLTLQVGDTEIKSNFFCDFCNNRCDSNWTFCCKDCNFKIDFDCARMLLNNSKQVQHYSHEHWLTFDWVRRRDRKYQCAACRQFCGGAIYCCKRCYFFLHRSCAEYPTKIQLSLHSNHPLTLRTGTAKIRECCDFCNLTCQALTFRCDPCNFKIDFSCVRMLTNFPTLNEITHFSHHHHSLKLNNNAMNENAFCYACKKHLPGDQFYHCSSCDFYLHKSCGLDLIEHYTDYKHIHSPLHNHRLAIVYRNSNVSRHVCCIVCDQLCDGPTYVCFLCKFNLHKFCLESLQTIFHSPFHNHPLAIVHRNSNVSRHVCCIVCDQLCDGPTYVCFQCKFNLHKFCLESLQTIIQNPFHKHPLIKFEKNVNDSTSCSACSEPCFDTTFACLNCKYFFHELCIQLPQEIQHFFHPCPLILRQETTKFTCKGCEKSRTQFAFHCDRCHFYLDVQCALMFTENFEGQKCIKNSSHRHPLILCNKERNGHVNCNGCLQVIFGEIYGCIQCNFYLHRSCAAAPQEIKHPFHPNHALTLRYGENLWCMVSILKSLDEWGKVKYLRHKHFSKHNYTETEVCCCLCEKSISGPSYNCIRCKFFIHQDCLEPVEKVQHPFYPHDHVLTPTRKFRCNACYGKTHNRLSVFFYGCDLCNFKLDVQCASLKPSINYKGHKHQVTFFKKVYDDPECEVCKFDYTDPPSYLRCVKCDDFNVHLLCAALPSTIKHKCHIDPLYLEDYFADDDSSDDDSGEYYCDACEETRDKRECVYRCAECSNYVAHINCVLDEVLLSISGKRGKVEFRNVDRDMADKRGLTLAHIFNPSNEDEQKEFKGVEVAISDLIRERMSKAEVMENDDILEDLEWSDETFILFLKSDTFGDAEDKIEECSGITFWDLDSKVVKVRDYKVSKNFVPILKNLFIKYGDISEKSPLNLGTKTRFLNIFCGVVHSMCSIKAKNINRTLLFNWWKNFKLVQEAKFDIQFAFDHLYRYAQSFFRILGKHEIDHDIHFYRMEIDHLTTELEGLKVNQEEHIRSMKGKSKLEKDILVEDCELLSKTVWTDSL